MDRDARRQLPPVSAVLAHAALAESLVEKGQPAVLRAVRSALEEARQVLQAGSPIVTDLAALAGRSRAILERDLRAVRPVINATGVLLHTGLGRAPLAEEAIASVAEITRGYCSLELDLNDGERGQRTAGIARLVCELTGAEAATAVNNNAGATVLALAALAAGREVIVSRGQLVEIGGSFRLPEILELSGARLREVGTTNKTRLADYERAITTDTAAVLRVHRSNFRIVGFTSEPDLKELAPLAHERGLWMIDDIGSGALGPGRPPCAADEPTAAAGVAAGAHVVLFSGDKLLGGPQSGIMAGTQKAITLVERHPLFRALRLDKMTLAALEATLRLALDVDRASERIPLWSMMAIPVRALSARAVALAATLQSELGLSAAMVPAEAFLGGGSAPFQPLPSAAVAIGPPFPSPFNSESDLVRALRQTDPPVVARVHDGAVLLDLRTVAEDRERDLLDAIRQVCHDRITSAQSNGPEDRRGTPAASNQAKEL